jgi:hypothetical protein
MSASRMRIVLFSESCRKLMCVSARIQKRDHVWSYPAKFLVVMPGIKQEFEHVLVPFDYSPRQRCVPLRSRIGVSHINTLDKTLDEKEVVFCTISVL